MRTHPWLFLLAAVVVLGAVALLRGDAGAQANVSMWAAQRADTLGGFARRGSVSVRELPPYDASNAGEASTPARTRRIARPQPGGPVPQANAIDTADGATAGPAGGTAPVAPDRNFEGLDAADVNGIFDYDLTPPDPQVAVGPDHIFEMVNSLGRIFDKGGNELQTFPLVAFFVVPDGYHDADPRVLYDALSGRWFASYMAYNDSIIGTDQGELEFAVSETSDPTGVWDTYYTTYADVFPDYPSLGVTDDKVTISSNVWDIDAPPGPAAPGCEPATGFCGAQTTVLQKSDLLAGADVATSVDLGPDPDRATIRAARSLSSVNDQYLAEWSTSALDELVVSRITGTPDAGNVTEASMNTLSTLVHDTPPPSRTAGAGECIVFGESGEQHLGSPPCIDSGDGGMLDATWRDNVLWTSSTAVCMPGGDPTARACAHLVEVETDGAPSVVQDIMFGAADEYYSWPAVTTDASNNLYVSLTRTKTTVFAEMRATGRMASDPPNTMGASMPVRTGDLVHTSGRWGDYLGAATDPEAPGCVWLAGEYAKATGGSDWGTYIAALSYNASCGAAPPPLPTRTPSPTVPPPEGTPTSSVPPVDTPTNTPGAGETPTPTSTSTSPTFTPSQGTPTPSALRGDANCDGRISSLDALAVLQFSAGLLTSLPCGAAADVNHDGRVNSLDAALILQYDAGLIPGFPAGTAAGEVATIRVGSLTQAVDQAGAVTLQSRNMPLPGLGAWTVDIEYDGAIVAATSCAGLFGSLCNASYDVNTVRAVGAVGSGGYVGDKDLASLSFRCVAEGETALHISIRVLADGTAGDPQPISAVTQDGTILCVAHVGAPGDVNCDGHVNAIDAALVLQLSAGIISSLSCAQNADVNNDGHVNAIDAALILQYVAGLIGHL